MTRWQQQKLRERAAKMIEGGASINEVASEFGKSRTWVFRVREQYGPPKEDLQSLKDRAVEMVKDGKRLRDIANELNQTYGFVQRACLQANVHPMRTIKSKTLSIIAQLQNTDLEQVEIARRMGVSRQQVSAIYLKAREAGIRFNRESFSRQNPVPSGNTVSDSDGEAEKERKSRNDRP